MSGHIRDLSNPNPIDWTKPIRVKTMSGNGCLRRFVCRDPESDPDFPVIYCTSSGGLYRAKDSGVGKASHTLLENVPPEPVVFFLNVYWGGQRGVKQPSLDECLAYEQVNTGKMICVLRIETVDGVRTKVEVVHTY